jgi:hypothetical protein
MLYRMKITHVLFKCLFTECLFQLSEQNKTLNTKKNSNISFSL